MVNLSGINGTLSAILSPKLILPRLIIPDISHLNWKELKRNGITGIVIDKDNCITKPGQDTLVPSLKSSWNDLLSTFGSSNVLIVSNSAGTNKDSLLLQAESVSRNLQVPVLIHPVFKPGKQCAISTAHYFLKPIPPSPSSPFLQFLKRKIGLKSKAISGAVVWTNKSKSISLYPTPTSTSTYLSTSTTPSSFSSPHQLLLVIGDRLATDMILSHRITSLSTSTSLTNTSNPIQIRAIPILTTTLHASESIGTTILRSLEKLSLRIMKSRPITIQYQSSGPWDSCVYPPLPSSSLTPSSSTPSLTYPAFIPPLLTRILTPIYTHLIALQKAYNYQTEWNWTEKTKALYKQPGGMEFWAEKLVDRAEEVVDGGKERIRRVSGEVRGRF